MPVDWSKEFNALPVRQRKIGAAMELTLRIQHLRFEKERLIARHRQSIREIDDHIHSCEESLRRREQEWETEIVAESEDGNPPVVF